MGESENPIYPRCLNFSVEVILALRGVKQDSISRPLISQLTRSATSIGANLGEAHYGASRKDFINKITIALKESQETLYWLEVMTKTDYLPLSQSLINEATEIHKILSTIKKRSVEPVP